MVATRIQGRGKINPESQSGGPRCASWHPRHPRHRLSTQVDPDNLPSVGNSVRTIFKEFNKEDALDKEIKEIAARAAGLAQSSSRGPSPAPSRRKSSTCTSDKKKSVLETKKRSTWGRSGGGSTSIHNHKDAFDPAVAREDFVAHKAKWQSFGQRRDAAALKAANAMQSGGFVIDPRNSRFMPVWDIIMLGALSFVAIVTPYEVTFLEERSIKDLDALFYINRFVD
eukprot:2835949-Prymnesium_polylepis.1